MQAFLLATLDADVGTAF